MIRVLVALSIVVTVTCRLQAEVGDPQIQTDHPWYPGELACSTFDRLFATQAKVYQRETGQAADTDHHKALASWYWRNTHYWHGEAGGRDLWAEGLGRGHDSRQREYWGGLFAYGFGLCGTTHSQWTAELETLLGHGRGRGVGAAGHNALEVFLRGGEYGVDGRWALLDHDLSTVIFDESGRRLLGLDEIQADVDRLIDRNFKPQKQHGWLVCGLHRDDGNSYRKYAVAEYLPGYAGPPPMVNLRRGERMRRYFAPGLADGKTFVFWGRNYNTDGIPGPERSRTWVNQPDQMYRSVSGTSHQNGQVRYANVEYIYRPDFSAGHYKEGVVDEGADHIVYEFCTPYVIGATPPNDSPWGIYDDGCTGGLSLRSDDACDVTVSTNAGRSWSDAHRINGLLDLTDLVKGHSQYWLRFAGGAEQLVDSGLEIRTVCQANVAVLPRLKEDGTVITYGPGSTALQSFGPESDLAQTFITDGGFGQSMVTLSATARRPTIRVYAAAHIASGSPPSRDVRYQIECSRDNGKTWQPIVADWTIPRRGREPGDFWSQSFCYGSGEIAAAEGDVVHIRFRNDGGKRYLRAEAHLVQKSAEIKDALKVTYNWIDDGGTHQRSHQFADRGQWKLDTGKNVRTNWVEFEPAF